MRISVRVTPRASGNAISGFDGSGTLVVRVSVPVDGAANEAVVKLLAKTLGIPARDLVLVSGANSRTKLFDVPLTVEEVRSRLALR